MTATVELVLPAGATLAEGPHWDPRAQRLYWVDIPAHRVYVFDPQTGAQQSFDVGQYVGAVVPRATGGLLLAVQHGFAILDPASGHSQPIAEIAAEADEADLRFNDGKCDPAGRFWAGSYSMAGRQRAGSLYCLDANGDVRRAIADVTVSNGLAWSRDHTTMYYIDTPTQAVAAFDYDVATGAIANRRVVISIPAGCGWPDGMTIDAEGMLWVAHWGGSCVTRMGPGARDGTGDDHAADCARHLVLLRRPRPRSAVYHDRPPGTQRCGVGGAADGGEHLPRAAGRRRAAG